MQVLGFKRKIKKQVLDRWQLTAWGQLGNSTLTDGEPFTFPPLKNMYIKNHYYSVLLVSRAE
jgi:hypothetical protein